MKSSRHCSPFRTREVKHPVSATNQPSKKKEKKKRLAAHSNDLIVGINRLKRCGKHSLRRIAPPSLPPSIPPPLPASSQGHANTASATAAAGVQVCMQGEATCAAGHALRVCVHPLTCRRVFSGRWWKRSGSQAAARRRAFPSFRRSTSGSASRTQQKGVRNTSAGPLP